MTQINGYLQKNLLVSKVPHFQMSSQSFKLIKSEMLKLQPLKRCKSSFGLYGGSDVGEPLMSSSQFCHTICRKISKLLKLISQKPSQILNYIKFGRVVKKVPLSITFQKFGPVVPNLHNIVFDDVI